MPPGLAAVLGGCDTNGRDRAAQHGVRLFMHAAGDGPGFPEHQTNICHRPAVQA